MNQKFFKKNIEKMAKYNPYFIIDGENYAVTLNTISITSKYSRAHSVGGFCPEMKLYTMLKKKKKGAEYNLDKYEKEVKSFIKDKNFVVSTNVAFKALVAGGYNEPLNLFIVLPNLVYKYLGKKIVKRMIKIAGVDFDFIYTQEDLKEKMKMLNNLLDPKEMKEIDNVSKKIEKKYSLKFMRDNDEY